MGRSGLMALASIPSEAMTEATSEDRRTGETFLSSQYVIVYLVNGTCIEVHYGSRVQYLVGYRYLYCNGIKKSALTWYCIENSIILRDVQLILLD